MSLFKKFQMNKKGRDYVVGDIHGCYTSLEEALRKVAFNPTIDRLFSVGDLVNRGHESHRVLEFLRQPWFHPVRGNHEQMYILHCQGLDLATKHAKKVSGWLKNCQVNDLVEIYNRFDTLVLAFEVEIANGRVGILHGDIQHTRWDDYVEEMKNATMVSAIAMQTMWRRDRHNANNQAQVSGVNCVYVGHTPVKQAMALGNVHYIDTGCVYGNVLTLCELGKGVATTVPLLYKP